MGWDELYERWYTQNAGSIEKFISLLLILKYTQSNFIFHKKQNMLFTKAARLADQPATHSKTHFAET